MGFFATLVQAAWRCRHGVSLYKMITVVPFDFCSPTERYLLWVSRTAPPLQQQQRHTCVLARAAKASNNSFDAEDELDKDLAEELSRFRTPDTFNKVAQHLDLVWKIGRVSA